LSLSAKRLDGVVGEWGSADLSLTSNSSSQLFGQVAQRADVAPDPEGVAILGGQRLVLAAQDVAQPLDRLCRGRRFLEEGLKQLLAQIRSMPRGERWEKGITFLLVINEPEELGFQQSGLYMSDLRKPRPGNLRHVINEPASHINS
jgi:hypothetical protein